MSQIQALQKDKKSDYGLTDSEFNNLNQAIEDKNVANLNNLINDLHAADIADYVDNISTEKRSEFVNLTKSDFSPEILVELSSDVKEEVLCLLGAKKCAKIINNLDTDDAIDVMEDLDEIEQNEIIDELPKYQQLEIKNSLAYPEDSAGRLVDKRIISIPEFWTVGKTIDYLQNQQDLPDDFYQIFLVDPKMKPSGAVLLSRIITAKKDEKILDLKQNEFKVIPAGLDQEEVAYIFRQYNLLSAPVVNEEDRMIGIITIDDIVSVIEEEAHEDIMRLGGVSDTDFYTDFISAAKRRFPWLAINLITAVVASLVIAIFEGVIQKLASLAVLMPIVASMGGNAGTQSVTVTVRSIATKQLDKKNTLKIIKKELYVGLINGLAFAILSYIASFIWYQDSTLSFVFSLATFLTLTFSGVSGTIVPVSLVKFGADPAIASSVVLTTITDILAFGLFLGLASFFI